MTVEELVVYVVITVAVLAMCVRFYLQGWEDP